MFKFNKATQERRAEARLNSCTGHDQFVRPPVSDKKAKHIMKKLNKQNGLKRSNSAIEFDVSAVTAANRRNIFSDRSMSSEHDNSDQSEHSEKSPLVSARLDNLARLFFSKSMPTETGSRDTINSLLTTRPNIKCQYSALDCGNNIVERSPRERAHRERALNATQEWVQNSNNRYDIIAHLDEIGSRHGKNWFLVTDATVRTDRLLSLLTLPPDCVAFEEFSPSENPKNILTELLGSLHHPYIYPVLDLGFLRTSSGSYACLVTPFNSKGSLKDLIYKAQWNEPWSRKYTRKPNGLPVTQIQRLGRQILEALLFLKERGFPLHGHLHSGNVILQNGAARLTGLENGLLGLSSRVNAVVWSRSVGDIENIDIICFGHLIYEMCMGQEMSVSKPSMRALEMEMEHYPQILDVLSLIFEPPNGLCPTVEDLVLCDLFRSIDLRELRGPCFNAIKPHLSQSTLNLLQAVKKRHCATLGTSLSADNSPCTPPLTPKDYKSGRTRESFESFSNESEEGLLDEIVVGCNYHQQNQWQLLHCYHHQHPQQHYHHYYHHRYHHACHESRQQQQQTQQQHQELEPELKKYQCQIQQSYQRKEQQQQQKASMLPSTAHHHSYPHLTQKTLYETVESPLIHYCCNDATQLDDERSVDTICTNNNFMKNTIEQEQQAQSRQSTNNQQQQLDNKEVIEQKSASAVQQPIICCSSKTSSNLNLKICDTNSMGLSSGGCSMTFDINGMAAMTDSLHSSESSTSVGTTTANTIISHDDIDNNQLLQIHVQQQQLQQLQQKQQLASLDNQQQTLQQTTIICELNDIEKENIKPKDNINIAVANGSTSNSLTTAAVTFNHQLTADMCNFKNSKSRRLEYSLKCLKYGKSNPSQDSAFGSLTDTDLSAGSSSFRLNSFQSVSSPIDEEGVEDVIIATTTVGQETCLELATLPRNMISQDSAISSPCRESSPNNFLHIDGDGSCSGTSSSSSSTGNLRPQHFPLSPKILVTAKTNSSNSSLPSSTGTPLNSQQSSKQKQQQQQPQQQPQQLQQQQQQFDPPKILVNDQNSIYTTSPSKRSGTVEVFSQKYRVSSFEDMSPNKNNSNTDKHHLKNVNRLAFRSLEEERRIDNAFIPIADRTHSENRVNVQSEKYKKLTHASFRFSKASNHDLSGQLTTTSPGSSTEFASSGSGGSCSSSANAVVILEMQKTSTVSRSGSTSGSGTTNSRQTMWRDSKFYRKNRIAKSNDSLLDTSPNHSARLSPSFLRDNHYESSSSYGGRSKSRQSLNRGGSTNEILGSNQMLALTPEITVTTTSFCNHPSNGTNRRYCSSKSEDLEDTSDYLRIMDTRKSYSERHLVTLTTLKQTAINNINKINTPQNYTEPCYLSENELSIGGNENNASSSTTTHHLVTQCCIAQQQQSAHQKQQQQQQRQMRHYRKTAQSNKEQQMSKFAMHEYQLKHYTNQFYKKRSHPNQLSWSSNSINRLKTTNIKTTSLATLNCHQQPQQHQQQQHQHSSTNSAGTIYNLQQFKQTFRTITATLTSPQHQHTSTNNLTTRNDKQSTKSNTLLSPKVQQIASNTKSPKRSQTHSRNSNATAFKAYDNATDTSTTSDNSNGSSINIMLNEYNNSSPDESPSGRTLSDVELVKIFSLNGDTTNNSCCCSEEKTPLLDSVEMSPISPTQVDDDNSHEDGNGDSNCVCNSTDQLQENINNKV